MMKGRSLLRLACFLAAVVLVSVWGHEAQSSKAATDTAGRYADVVVIDMIGDQDEAEMPAVPFRHDLHTEAVQKAGKDCSACHETKEGQMVLSFKRTSDEGVDLKKLYHENCFACHAEQAAAGQDTGPQEGECRSCHNPEGYASSWQPIGMDKSLHYRHISAKTIKVDGEDKNCASCHHVYDEAAKKLVPANGKEDSCRACHKDAPVAVDGKNKPALRDASHVSCVTCHVETAKKTTAKDENGPVTCAGCHTAEAQANIKTVTDVPRLMRGQPDAALITGELTKGTTNPVAFNHKVHEAATDTCRSCHHEKIASCVECHSIEGKKEGNFIQLEQAMHSAQSQASCVGCHAQQTENLACAGCHRLMPETLSEQSCAVCHIPGAPKADDLDAMTKEQRNMVAEAILTSRQERPATYNLADVPEKVKIDAMVDKYEAAELPHRKIIETMLAATQNNRLAANFHTDPGTFCQGCHHNSPASLQPPKCASCHGKPFQTAQGDRPGLKAAYHQQCMGCHDAMKIEKPKATACTSCHAKREN